MITPEEAQNRIQIMIGNIAADFNQFQEQAFREYLDKTGKSINDFLTHGKGTRRYLEGAEEPGYTCTLCDGEKPFLHIRTRFKQDEEFEVSYKFEATEVITDLDYQDWFLQERKPGGLWDESDTLSTLSFAYSPLPDENPPVE